MAATDFIAKAPSTKEALKSANLLKTLSVNALISGQNGVGKTTLAKYILNKAQTIEAPEVSDLEHLTELEDGLIIQNFNKIKDQESVTKYLLENSIRVVATSTAEIKSDIYDKLFSIGLELLPLKQRQEDIQPLAKKFLKEAQDILSLGMDREIKPERLILDLKDNCHSLRRSIFFTFLIDDMGENEIMFMMENYLLKKVGGNNDYRDYLYLFEAPIIRAELKTFKSQLKVAEKLGLNRNTLRKKIDELKELL